jgi:hypothetical protein
MKNSQVLVACASALVAAGGLIAFQYNQNMKLRTEAKSLRELKVVAAGMSANGSSSSGVPGAKKSGDSTGEASGGTSAYGSIKEILAQRDPMGRMRALLGFVEGLSVDQIAGALEELRTSAPDWDPEAKFVAHMLLTRWGKEDPAGAFAAVEKMDAKRGGGDALTILASVAATDPRRAAEWLNDPDNALRERPKMDYLLAGTIAKEWVRQDPNAAWEWAQGLPEEQRGGALRGVLDSLVSTDPGQAAEMVRSLDDDKMRHGLVGDIAESWAKRTPDLAMEWAQSLEGAERNRAVEETLDGWAQSAPKEAAAFIDQLPENERTDRQIAQVAREWGRRDPADAAAWLGAQPEGEGKAASIGEVIYQWTARDPEAASTWLGDQPPGESYDNGAQALAKATFESDPTSAVAWAASIGNEERRTDMIDGGLRWWNGRDPEAAQAWAKENGITLPAGETRGGDRDEK